MGAHCFRDFVSLLDAEGQLVHLTRPVAEKYEAAALMKFTSGKTPMVMEHVGSTGVPLVSGIGGTRGLIAQSVGCGERNLDSVLADAIASPLTNVQFRGSAPVQQVRRKAPFDLSALMPILTFNEGDVGPFVVSSMMVARSDDGSREYTSVRRMQYLGGNRLTVLITSREMREQFERYERRHQPMDVAFVLGVTPSMLLASQISTHLYDCDKLAVAGALVGEPVPVCRCLTVDVDVPAEAEFVLEGHVLGWEKVTEGPFGEMGGYYGTVSERPVVELTCVTSRQDPLAQLVFPSGYEEKLPMGIAREVGLLATVRQTVPGVCAAYITPPTLGRLHAVIQIHKEAPFDGKQAALAAFASDKDLKHVVVVDDDVDPQDPEQVEWAIATRMQADRDVFIIPGCNGSPLEASHVERGMTAKMGLDATYKHGDPIYRRTHVPGEESVRIEDYL